MDTSTGSQQNQDQRKQQREAQLKAALAGLSESEAEPETQETEEEREAREVREKQVLGDGCCAALCCIARYWVDIVDAPSSPTAVNTATVISIV